MRVTKEVTFDCAHMLSGHNGLCANLHGHTYKLQVGVEGDQIAEGSSEDMVIDFKDLKAAINDVVMADFDHATIFSCAPCRSVAEEALLRVVQDNELRHVIMPERTTAEDMAKYFKSSIKAYLTRKLGYNNVTNVTIRLYETPTSFVEV